MAVRFLLDENLSERLVLSLAPRFASSLHVRQLGLGGATDLRLWELAITEQCVLVTKDEDFVKLSVFAGRRRKSSGSTLGTWPTRSSPRSCCRTLPRSRRSSRIRSWASSRSESARGPANCVIR